MSLRTILMMAFATLLGFSLLAGVFGVGRQGVRLHRWRLSRVCLDNVGLNAKHILITLLFFNQCFFLCQRFLLASRTDCW